MEFYKKMIKYVKIMYPISQNNQFLIIKLIIIKKINNSNSKIYTANLTLMANNFSLTIIIVLLIYFSVSSSNNNSNNNYYNNNKNYKMKLKIKKILILQLLILIQI